MRDTLAVSPALLVLLEKARHLKMTPDEIDAQRRSYVAAEMAMGSDADEAKYRAEVGAGDTATLARLNAEEEARHKRALAAAQEDSTDDR